MNVLTWIRIHMTVPLFRLWKWMILWRPKPWRRRSGVVVVVYQCTIITSMVSLWELKLFFIACKVQAVLKCLKQTICLMEPIQLLPHPGLDFSRSHTLWHSTFKSLSTTWEIGDQTFSWFFSISFLKFDLLKKLQLGSNQLIPLVCHCISTTFFLIYNLSFWKRYRYRYRYPISNWFSICHFVWLWWICIPPPYLTDKQSFIKNKN